MIASPDEPHAVGLQERARFGGNANRNETDPPLTGGIGRVLA